MDNKKHCDPCEAGKCIEGIVCDVKNCAYHHGMNDCYAGTIMVGPREATSSSGTNCATFKPKEC